MPRPPIRILLADDHEIVREGLRMLLEQEEDLEVVGEAGDGEEAVRLAAVHRPDVVLMDVSMPRLAGVEAARRILGVPGAPRVLMLSSLSEESAVRGAIEAGASGYLLKDLSKDELARALRAAVEDRPTLHPEAQRVLMRKPAKTPLDELTPRERSVLELLAEGRSNRQIANRLGLTEGTVKGYLTTIFAKLGVVDRTQAALLAAQHGLGRKG
jgi:DNA-binding NarL/FixJ family response regulator